MAKSLGELIKAAHSLLEKEVETQEKKRKVRKKVKAKKEWVEGFEESYKLALEAKKLVEEADSLFSKAQTIRRHTWSTIEIDLDEYGQMQYDKKAKTIAIFEEE